MTWPAWPQHRAYERRVWTFHLFVAFTGSLLDMTEPLNHMAVASYIVPFMPAQAEPARLVGDDESRPPARLSLICPLTMRVFAPDQ